MGTMDPQCIVRCGTQELKSVVIRSGGRDPAINWKVTLNASPQDTVKIIFQHPGAFSVSEIGTGTIPIAPLVHGQVVDKWHELSPEVRV